MVERGRAVERGQRHDVSATSGAKAGGGRIVVEVGRHDWRDDAACLVEDPELFFPVGTSGPALMQIAEAKTVCRACPVTEACLSWALASGQDTGVWGGTSEDERRALRSRGARTRARTA